MFKHYSSNVIRLRRGKSNLSQVYWIIVILNIKKTNSQKIVERLGYIKYGKKRICSINFRKLAFYLNKGFILKQSIIKLIYLYARYW
jgi:ribosomal protein S16